MAAFLALDAYLKNLPQIIIRSSDDPCSARHYFPVTAWRRRQPDAMSGSAGQVAVRMRARVALGCLLYNVHNCQQRLLLAIGAFFLFIFPWCIFSIQSDTNIPTNCSQPFKEKGHASTNTFWREAFQNSG